MKKIIILLLCCGVVSLRRHYFFEILLKYFKDNFSEYFINNLDKRSESEQLTLFEF